MRLSTFLSVIVIISSFQIVSAQRWFETGDIWVQKEFNGLSGYEGYQEVTVTGDTIVAGLESKVTSIYTKWVQLAFGGSSGESYLQRIVREKNDSVYYWTGSEYQLLYDFSLLPGDTIYYPDEDMVCLDSIRFILQDTSRIQIGQHELRVQQYKVYQSYWDYEDDRTIIENIGLVEGHFEVRPSFACFTDATGYNLCSFKRGMDSLLFMQQSCYDLPVSTDNIETIKLNLYPNPSKGVVYIESDEIIQKSNIYSIDGKLLYSIDRTHTKINLSDVHWIGGIYIIELYSNKGNTSRKRIYLEKL